ncbi:hypothetical protein BKA67DRAFT_683893 [Truncatella angustata]|uniref:Peptidase M3A/M3B catalytic domain-containing protein n=1 Tax=Truncatella angustata TaxID=152316 RepID=A0A9P8RIH5_9PEZI|nr:uncharacterized protein BKA67DRAFT_683893 [Truncatella angustata]KAH6646658.1 hypothetical protein BKA67DRAFT_683893 [Truncatella angustata]
MAHHTLPQELLRIIPGNEIVPTMERIVAEIHEVREVGVMAMLRYASPDAGSRESSDEACKLWVECEAEFTSRRSDLFHLYLDSLPKDFRLCGNGLLSVGQIKQYSETKKHIEDLRRTYNRNIRNEEGKQEFSLEELAGRNDVDTLLEYASNHSTRKKIHIASAHKLPRSVDLLREIVVERDENARLLGYESHAAFKLEKRAAKSPSWVIDLLNELGEAILPQGHQEMDRLLQLMTQDPANQTLQNQHGQILPWDSCHYAPIAEENIQVNHTKISEYFPMRNTVSAMLQIFASCLRLRFPPLPLELSEGYVLHQDVEMCSVWDNREDSRDEFVGYLYADLLSRPNKYQGSQNSVPGDYTYVQFSPSNEFWKCAGQASRDYIAFPQLGHGIHDLISRTSYVRFHSHSVVRKFAEALGVMLAENPDAPLPPKQIPDDILDSLIESRKTNRTVWFLRQLSHEYALKLNLSDIYHSLMERLSLLETRDINDRGYPFASIGHLTAGYNAGYFSLCQVFAADLFESAFAKDPRSHAAWDRCRGQILDPGASRDELQMSERFLGHPPSAEALLRNIKGT